MRKKRTITAAGIILVLLTVGLAGCQGDSLKASYYASRADSVPADELDAEASQDPETSCSVLDPHPMAVSMAEKFEVSYDQIMTWYCDGYAFSDILLALETNELVDQSTEELLGLLETRTWEEIWQDLGVQPQ